MTLYRCCLRKWAGDLTGTGAFLHGGRWNPPGTRLVYTAENNVLAAFEVALRIPLDHISKNYVMVPVEIPDDAEIASCPKLPKNWNTDRLLTSEAGAAFAREGKFLAMKVPSALISDSFNLLINPAHPLMAKVRAGEPRSILFDERLMNMLRVKDKPRATGA